MEEQFRVNLIGFNHLKNKEYTHEKTHPTFELALRYITTFKRNNITIWKYEITREFILV